MTPKRPITEMKPLDLKPTMFSRAEPTDEDALEQRAQRQIEAMDEEIRKDLEALSFGPVMGDDI